MYRKLILALVLTAALIMSTSACGSDSVPEKVQYEGTWTMEGGNDSFDMKATVSSDQIEILWLSDDSESLYWKGTFPAKDSRQSEVISDGDTEALASSLLGSTDDTKTFVFEDGSLTFPMTVMGTTKTIKLKK